ncbi:helix-turn-helix domain-containing protein [Phorcysia thermohydrogeniphila]|uniref:Excisionase family DNA binding protein n=1 Tax=Phorcysia thermohydrogeniphila TaxID=936138 RepID=A0A4V2PDV4_9BACT|nr:helix-turn-helix domain-containing protein [Phorcysia thermohydrogeniphila]TCK06346.1 excisionase family DNA binding protein [Phorcysia thermohydrogeniphila]
MPKELFNVKVYSVKEIARLLGKSESTIRRYIYDGQLGAIQIGREYLIPESELFAFIKKNQTKPNIWR